MPVRKRRSKRRAQASDGWAMWVCGITPADTPETQDAFQEYLTLEYFETDEEIEVRWRDHGHRAIEAWVAEHPGTRPEKWWKHVAPEPRRRLGGSGVLWSGKNGGFSTDRYVRGVSELVDVDDADPPHFETEYEYLHRLDLLLPWEAVERARGVELGARGDVFP